jgi:hypothetical protein
LTNKSKFKNMKLNHLIVLLFLFSFQFSKAQTELQESQFGSQINDYLNQNRNRYNLLENDINDLYVVNEVFSKSTQITHTYVNQRFSGIKIYNAISSISIKDASVFYMANRFINNINNKINTIIPLQNSQKAIETAVEHFELGTLQNLQFISFEGNKWVYSGGSISKRDIPVELVFYHNNNKLILAWDLSIYTTDGKDWWSVRIDASNNDVLEVTNMMLTCNFGTTPHNHSTNKNPNNTNKLFNRESSILEDGSKYNVFALPAESPNHGAIQVVTNPADDNASPFGWHDVDGVDGAEFTITRGNNVWAQEDRNGDNGTGFSPEGTNTLNFDFQLDIDQPPAGYQNVAITNLFYMNNMMHDIWYQYGFDEASGNFQSNNYGNGGIGSDFVFADAQDGSGVNNATFGTPADGGNPGMTMFLWNAAGPPGQPLTLNNGALAGGYTATSATFGESLSVTPITAGLVLTIDNNLGGTSTDLFDGCDSYINGSAVIGKIAVIRRGDCEFGFKVLQAELEGAVAVIIVNNVADDPITMGGGAVGGSVNIPSIMVNQADGEAMIAALLNGDTINGTIVAAAPYQKDGDFDNGIVGHEYGHGISTRLTGGAANPGCLNNAEQMGEGWSDWFALMVTMRSTDLPSDARGVATFAISQGVNGSGIRPGRYSPDFFVNSFTYSSTNNEGSISQPHGIGFVWATMLWDLTWAYIDKYGFDEDIFNGIGGNNKVMQLVIDGLKLQPCSPGFVDGRDAILAADMALTGGEDQCMIWEVFARRGLGFNASQGLTTSRTDQVQDFNEPPISDPSLANCNSLSIDEFSNNGYKIYPNPASTELFISTAINFGDVILTLTDINGRQVLSKNVILSNEISIDISQLQSGLYILNINGENINANEKIIKK